MNYMFKNKFIILIILFSTLIVGCNYKTTNTQIRDIGYLKFTKEAKESLLIIINDNYKFQLKACVVNKKTGNCHDDTINKLYEVQSGNINLKVYDFNNNFILNKNIYLGSNSTVEVDL